MALAWLLHVTTVSCRSEWHEGPSSCIYSFPLTCVCFPLLFSVLCRRKIYGPNLIEVPVKPYVKLLVEEVCVDELCFQRTSSPSTDPSSAPCPSLHMLYGPFLSGREERARGEQLGQWSEKAELVEL